jgi:two-component system cell cycle sensor histidine kinase/response regulator CckA
MDSPSIRHKLMKRLLYVMMIVVSVVGPAVGLVDHAAADERPRAIRGELDLTHWSLQEQGHVRLDGEWAFYWGRLIDPKAFSGVNPPAVSGYISVPGTWNGFEVDGKALSGQGVATYRLVVRLGKVDQQLALKVLDAATSLTVFVNGSPVMAAGTPGLHANETVPGYRPGVVRLEVSGNRLDIVLHVSNFDHWQGGLWETIVLGTASELPAERHWYLYSDLFLFAGILIIGLYHLVLFLLRTQDRSPLYFAFFCLFMALRTVMTGERFILSALPDLSWAILNKSVYIGLYMAIPSFALYTWSLFPQEASKRLIYFFALIGIGFSAFTAATPMRIYSYTMPVFQLLIFLIMLYGIYVVVLASIRRREGALIFLTGFIVLFSAGVNDILYSRQLINTAYVVSFGLLVFMFSQAFLLAKRFSKAFAVVEKQGLQINRANISLRREIEEHHRTEEALKASESKYRLLADNVHDTIWTMDLESRRLNYMSPSVMALLGYSLEELKRMTLQDIVTPESYGVVEVALEEITREQGASKQMDSDSRVLELEMVRKDDAKIWTETRVTFIPSRSDTSARLVGVTRDITVRKQMEAALRNRESQYRQLVRQAPAAIYEIDFQRERFISVNEIMCEMTGYSREELLSMSPMELLTWDSRQVYLRRMEEIFAGGPVPEWLEYRIRTKHGDERWVLIHINYRFRDGLAWGATVVGQDITERKLTEGALREWEEKYRTLIENVTDGIVVFQDNKVVFANPQAFKHSGFSKEDLLNSDIWDLIHPDDKDFTRERHIRVLSGEILPDANEYRFVKKGGGYLWVRSRAILIEWEGRPAVLTFNEDITEQKHTIHEKGQLQVQLQQAQKMEAMGTLASGIAHDFNNFLQGITGYLELMKRQVQGQPTATDYLSGIGRIVERSSDLVGRLLSFSRKEEGSYEPLDINNVVQQGVGILRHSLPKMIRVQAELAENLRYVIGDAGQLIQVLLNLAMNSKDAMPNGGTLKISSRNLPAAETSKLTSLDLPHGDYIQITVSDTGLGMDEEIQGRIFEPFFTTKGQGEGTGLGMAIVYNIIQSHGGVIICDSKPGQGTVFEVYLPAIENTYTHSDVKSLEMGELTGGSETILVVDDEPVIRTTVKDILEGYGYTVLTVDSGEAALDVYGKDHDAISLVMLDLGMPGMGGRVCLDKLMEINPDVKVLVASGYIPDNQMQDVMTAGAARIIRKPYRLPELLGTVRVCLDGE